MCQLHTAQRELHTITLHSSHPSGQLANPKFLDRGVYSGNLEMREDQGLVLKLICLESTFSLSLNTYLGIFWR